MNHEYETVAFSSEPSSEYYWPLSLRKLGSDQWQSAQQIKRSKANTAKVGEYPIRVLSKPPITGPIIYPKPDSASPRPMYFSRFS